MPAPTLRTHELVDDRAHLLDNGPNDGRREEGLAPNWTKLKRASIEYGANRVPRHGDSRDLIHFIGAVEQFATFKRE